MGDKAIPKREEVQQNPGEEFLSNLRQETGGLITQLPVSPQEIRNTVTAAENELLGFFGLEKVDRTISGNVDGLDLSESASKWSVTVGDFSLSRSPAGLNFRLQDTLQLASSPSGWSVKVGSSLDLTQSHSETQLKFKDPVTNALLSFDKTRTGFDLVGQQLEGTSFEVEKGKDASSISVNIDGLTFDIQKRGSKLSGELASSQDGSGYVFSEDPITRTFKIQDIQTGEALCIQRTALGTFRLTESQLPQIKFQPASLLDGERKSFPLPELKFVGNVDNGQNKFSLRIDPLEANLRLTSDLGPASISVAGTQNYSLPDLFTKQSPAHSLGRVLGSREIDLKANFAEQFGVQYCAGGGQSPSIRLLHGLGNGNFVLGGEYHLDTGKGALNLQKKFPGGWIMQLNAGKENVGAEIRFEPNSSGR